MAVLKECYLQAGKQKQLFYELLVQVSDPNAAQNEAPALADDHEEAQAIDEDEA